LLGKNRTDFVIDATRQAAQNALLDRTVIPINVKAHAAFVALLDAPPQPNERLLKSLQTPARPGISKYLYRAQLHWPNITN
jgi:uncharacterized protein (DUF1778 family)